MIRGAALSAAVALLGAQALRAQLPTVRGYYLNVPLWSDSTQFAVGGFGDLQRLRVMATPQVGPVAAEIAYEHLLSYSERAVAAPLGALLQGVAPGGGEWLDLQWTLKETSHWLWRHRFDRLNVTYSGSDLIEVTAGRQTISWATTLFLTPADPFAPFDPADPFREYRVGVDALRIKVFPGPLSEVDLVARIADTAADTTLTLLSRGRTTWRGWELSAWTGLLHDDPALSLGATGAIGRVALRSELSLRDRRDNLRARRGGVALRGAVGVDTRFTLSGRELYVVIEYQHDGFGASRSEELASVVFSEPFARGELQVLGQDITAVQGVYQMHPLLATDLLVLVNLNDGSALLGPGASYSASSEVTLRAGLFLGLGDAEFGPSAQLPSEFGIVPAILYVSGSAFF